ncbi:F-box protein PP2-B7 [Glycine soja]
MEGESRTKLEECLAKIVLHATTTPMDACGLSLVSKAFVSAAENDIVWDRFIASHSKKALFFTLSDRGTKVPNH